MFAAVHESGYGTNLPFRNVHYMTAFGGDDPGIEPTSVEDWF